MEKKEGTITDSQQIVTQVVTNENKHSIIDLFTKHNRINLLNYLSDFLLYEDVLSVSSMNSHVYNHIKKKKCTDKLKTIKTKYLSNLNTTAYNFLDTFRSMSIQIL